MVDSAGARLKERGWNRGCKQAEAAVPRDQKERLGSQLSLLTFYMCDQGKQVNLVTISEMHLCTESSHGYFQNYFPT